MSIRNILRGAASVFVELPPDLSKGSSDPYSPGVGGNALPVPSQPNGPTDSAFDFEKIYRQAGIVGAPLKAEQIRGMLSRLPRTLPQETKREMMREMLTTLGKPAGATIDSIVADAAAKISALNTCVVDANKNAENLAAATQSDIEDLNRQIAQKRHAIETSKRDLTELERQCLAERQRLGEVLEFFRQEKPS
jgi:hypothetical protein